jgi:transposase InsO family protein
VIVLLDTTKSVPFIALVYVLLLIYRIIRITKFGLLLFCTLSYIRINLLLSHLASRAVKMSFHNSSSEILNIHTSPREIEDYLERFELWCLTKGELATDVKTAHFLTSIGKEAYALLKNLSFPDAPSKKTYDELKSILLAHVMPQNFEIAERAKFNVLQRQTNQSIREFILQLQTQASRCAFGDKLDDHLRDRLIAGINIPDLYRQLLLAKNPTFVHVKQLCEQYQDVTELSKEQPSSNEQSVLFGSIKNQVHASGYKQRQHNRVRHCVENQPNASEGSSTFSKQNFGQCASCGKSHSRYTCPYRNVKCFQCGKLGHIQSVCRAVKRCQFVDSTEDTVESVSDDLYSLALTVSTPTRGHLYQNIQFLNGKSHDFIVDTGSVESLISKASLDMLYPNTKLEPTPITIRGITGHSMPILGACKLSLLAIDSETVVCDFIVTVKGPSVLGLKALRSLKFSLSFLSQIDNDKQIRSLIHHCSLASGGMKISPVHLEINCEPIFMKRRLISYGLREPVKKALQSLCDRGILIPVEASQWATPIVTPLKQDGRTPRVCGDYRVTLNPKLLQRSCTTVEPEAILSRLHGSCIFSKIDLKDAYLQIPLDERSSQLTTINTPFGLYQYRFLPFGLSVSPAIFQDVMNNIVKGLDGVEVYQDDVIIHAPDKVVHDHVLLAVLTRFKEVNVKINPGKCSIALSEIECLGYLVNSKGFQPDINRLKPLVEAKSPTNIHELRSVMGALQYYSKFIPNFASIADPLFILMNAVGYEWSSKHEQIFRGLLSMLNSDAVLRPFTPKLRPVLITDASPFGIGAVLEQNGHPVLCISRRLSKAEQGYAQTHREALAVYWSVMRLHKYLFGLQFTIVTDHEALKFIYSPSSSLAKSSAAMVQRWSIALSAYDYTIEHRSAKHIPHVDYISRNSSNCEATSESDCLIAQPLPISRSELLSYTKKYFGPVIAATKRGWSSISKRKFPQFFARRDELCHTSEGLLCLNDRIVIPPPLRSVILKDLHSGHLGVEKMKSLARCLCWWPEIDADIRRTTASCEGCQHKVLGQPSKWTPWPLACEAWQRIHIDYCGPFLQKYFALVIIDSYSKWPEVFFTEKPNAEFTMLVLRKVFSRDGVPVAVVSDNGSHFSASCVTQWLHSLGCRHLFTAPRHPQSNGLAENFVGTLKRAITSCAPATFKDLDRFVDNFLLQYRNCAHSTTGQTPAQLSKSRSLRSNLLGLGSAEVSYYRGNNFRPSKGIVVDNLGRRMVKILDLDDCSVHKRHSDQVLYKDSGQLRFDTDSVDNSNPQPILDSADNVHDQERLDHEPRRSVRLRNKPPRDYKNPENNSSCGGCGDCTSGHH